MATKHKTWFDLIRLHLKMFREQKLVQDGKIVDHKRDYLRKHIELGTDGMLDYIVERRFNSYKELLHDKEKRRKMGGKNAIGAAGRNMNAGEYAYTCRLFDYLDQHQAAQTKEDKVSLMTKFLNLWHYGGDTNYAILLFAGIPYVNSVVGTSERVFLNKLENYDGPEFWERKSRLYKKSITQNILCV
ncbi:MAG: hypothetical protein ACXW1F_07475 [Halobacteriota archaeon]